MKYYFGFFRDTNTDADPDGQLYKVVVKTKKGTGTEELLLSGNPFIVTYESSAELFKPYKCSTAVVGMLNKEYNEDFICESITDNEVLLYKLKEGVEYSDALENQSADSQYFNLEWCGYTTPNVYSQGYNSYYDEFELECQDKLSILKYYRWDDITHVATGQRISIYNILYDICTFLGIEELSVTKSLRIPNSTILRDYDYNFIIRMYVLVSTFYEDDEPKYLIEILEDIMLYISLTVMQIRNNLYVVNYNAIATGFSDYETYNMKTYVVGTTKIQRVYDINPDDSASNTTNLSVKESYDDFVVTTSPSEIDRSFPSVEWYNKTLSNYNDALYSQCNGKIALGSDISTLAKMAEWDGYSVYQQILGHTVEGYTSMQFYSFNQSFEYYAPEMKFYGYAADESVAANNFVVGGEITNYKPGQCCLTGSVASIRNRVSAMPISYGLIKAEDYGKQLDGSHEDGIFICHPLSNVSDMTNEEWLDLISSQILINQQPMADITYRNVNLTPAHPLCFRAEVQFFADYIPCCFESSGTIQRANDRLNMSVILKTADGRTLYYDGANRRWTTALTIMYPSIGVKYGDKIFGEKHKLNNNSTNAYNVSEYSDGVVISAFGQEYHGDITIRIFRPFGPDNTFARTTTSTLLTGISLEYLDCRDYSKNFVADDTKYEYKDKSKFINEIKSEELKYTASLYNPNIDNNIYTQTEDGEYKILDYILDIPSGDVFRCEEQRLRDNTKQFLTPQVSMETCVHADVDMLTRIGYNRFDKTFVVNGLEIDYRNNSRTFNMIEKK